MLRKAKEILLFGDLGQRRTLDGNDNQSLHTV